MRARIIVGGPPNSGKSTFSVGIAGAMMDKKIDASLVDLDPWAPTTDLIRGNISQERRDSRKKERVTMDELRGLREYFLSESEGHDIVIGDAPGGISRESGILCEAASHAIIVCRNDMVAEIGAWMDFFGGYGIKVVATITSKVAGNEEINSCRPIRATLVGLDRTWEETSVRSKLADLLLKAL